MYINLSMSVSLTKCFASNAVFIASELIFSCKLFTKIYFKIFTLCVIKDLTKFNTLILTVARQVMMLMIQYQGSGAVARQHGKSGVENRGTPTWHAERFTKVRCLNYNYDLLKF